MQTGPEGFPVAGNDASLSLEQLLSGLGPAVFAHIRIPFGIFDTDSRIIWINPTMAHVHGCSVDDVGRHCYDVFHGCDIDCTKCPMKEALSMGRTRILEGSMDLPGGRRWGEMHAYPVRGSDRRVSAVIALVFETTGHKHALQKQQDYAKQLEHRLNEKEPDSSVKLEHGSVQLTVRLSSRERDVPRLICEGYTNMQIGELLSISGHTVKSHVNALFNKLGVNDRTQAAVVATRAGIV